MFSSVFHDFTMLFAVLKHLTDNFLKLPLSVEWRPCWCKVLFCRNNLLWRRIALRPAQFEKCSPNILRKFGDWWERRFMSQLRAPKKKNQVLTDPQKRPFCWIANFDENRRYFFQGPKLTHENGSLLFVFLEWGREHDPKQAKIGAQTRLIRIYPGVCRSKRKVQIPFFCYKLCLLPFLPSASPLLGPPISQSLWGFPVHCSLDETSCSLLGAWLDTRTTLHCLFRTLINSPLAPFQFETRLIVPVQGPHLSEQNLGHERHHVSAHIACLLCNDVALVWFSEISQHENISSPPQITRVAFLLRQAISNPCFWACDTFAMSPLYLSFSSSLSLSLCFSIRSRGALSLSLSLPLSPLSLSLFLSLSLSLVYHSPSVFHDFLLFSCSGILKFSTTWSSHVLFNIHWPIRFSSSVFHLSRRLSLAIAYCMNSPFCAAVLHKHVDGSNQAHVFLCGVFCLTTSRNIPATWLTSWRKPKLGGLSIGIIFFRTGPLCQCRCSLFRAEFVDSDSVRAGHPSLVELFPCMPWRQPCLKEKWYPADL